MEFIDVINEKYSMRGFLDKEGIESIKSTFAHVIFQDEMLNIQNDKTSYKRKQTTFRSSRHFVASFDVR